MAGLMLLAIHNVTFLIEEAQSCRKAILEGRFQEYFSRWSSARGPLAVQ
ncbi:MAG: Queuine tRNA-ribosyltransferase [bacterium ADurb.Bin425]|nr:MAG: Queuine tRNA-ribosyltransferase [bacterium ADurb.Bin425]